MLYNIYAEVEVRVIDKDNQREKEQYQGRTRANRTRPIGPMMYVPNMMLN